MTFYYPDVSDVGNRGLVIQPGTVAVCAKATEGSTFRDPSYTTFKGMAAAVGAVFSAYHWTWCSNMTAEADNIAGMAGDTPLMWDVENTARTQSVPELVELTQLVKARGCNPRLLYLPHWYWQGHMGSPDLQPLLDEGLRLVSSNYTTYSDGGPGWSAYGGATPYVWQYTSTLSYGGQNVDFNACRDTLDGFRSFLYPVTIVPVANPTPTKDFIVTNWTTIRQGDTGEQVKRWQGILIGNGLTPNGGVDGNFGPSTYVKTVRLQQFYGITADGVVGPHTISVGVLGADVA